MNYMHLSYAEWYQQIEKPRLMAIPAEARQANADSHMIGDIDDVARCIRCEIASWNSWQKECVA